MEARRFVQVLREVTGWILPLASSHCRRLVRLSEERTAENKSGWNNNAPTTTADLRKTGLMRLLKWGVIGGDEEFGFDAALNREGAILFGLSFGFHPIGVLAE